MSTHMYKIYALIHWTVLLLVLYTGLAPFRNQSKYLLKPPKGMGSAKRKGGNASLRGLSLLLQRRCKGPSSLLVITSLVLHVPFAAFLRKWGCCPCSVKGCWNAVP